MINGNKDDRITHLVLDVGDHQKPLYREGHRHEDGAGQGDLGQRQDDRKQVGRYLDKHYANCQFQPLCLTIPKVPMKMDWIWTGADNTIINIRQPV